MKWIGPDGRSRSSAARRAANIRTYNPKALVCADGPGDPPPGGNLPFVMLEYVGSFGTFHFNFPDQTGVSEVDTLDPNDGTYTTNYAPDCPWGGALGLRLWFPPELEPIVKYYRLKVVAVNDGGEAVGSPTVLDTPVSWDKLVSVPGDDIIRSGTRRSKLRRMVSIYCSSSSSTEQAVALNQTERLVQARRRTSK